MDVHEIWGLFWQLQNISRSKRIKKQFEIGNGHGKQARKLKQPMISESWLKFKMINTHTPKSNTSN